VPLSCPTYPISLVLAGHRCLVVGGGHVALRKVEGLLAAGARVTVVAPRVVEPIGALDVDLELRPYEAGEAARYRVVVAATGRPEIDRAVFADGERAGVLVNAADDIPGCAFILPAVVRRGPVSVAVSTAGTSPALASWLRDRVAGLVGPDVELLAAMLGRAREALRASGLPSESLPWRELLDGVLPGLVAAGRLDEAESVLSSWVARLDSTRETGDPRPACQEHPPTGG
jgi:siroheme synthase-like protein